jgi:hypothetical protein
MSRAAKPFCPFDWEKGRNDKLRGGRLLGVSNHLFAYVFPGDDAPFTNGFVAAKFHGQDIPTLLTAYPVELGNLLRAFRTLLGEDSYNVYANHGSAAGMTVGNHAHLHVLRRSARDHANGMGFGKLVAEYNKLYTGLQHLST